MLSHRIEFPMSAPQGESRARFTLELRPVTGGRGAINRLDAPPLIRQSTGPRAVSELAKIGGRGRTARIGQWMARCPHSGRGHRHLTPVGNDDQSAQALAPSAPSQPAAMRAAALRRRRAGVRRAEGAGRLLSHARVSAAGSTAATAAAKIRRRSSLARLLRCPEASRFLPGPVRSFFVHVGGGEPPVSALVIEAPQLLGFFLALGLATHAEPAERHGLETRRAISASQLSQMP